MVRLVCGQPMCVYTYYAHVQQHGMSNISQACAPYAVRTMSVISWTGM